MSVIDVQAIEVPCTCGKCDGTKYAVLLIDTSGATVAFSAPDRDSTKAMLGTLATIVSLHPVEVLAPDLAAPLLAEIAQRRQGARH